MLTAALSVLPPAQYPHGSAIMTTLQQVAGAAGTAAFVTTAVGFSTEPTGLPDATGLRAAFMVAGAVGVLAIVGALLLRGREDHPTAPAGETAHTPDGPVGVTREAAPPLPMLATVQTPQAGGRVWVGCPAVEGFVERDG